MLRVIKGVEKLKWELDLLDKVFPEAIEHAIEAAKRLTIDDVFSSDAAALIEFLDTVYFEIRFRGDPMLRAIAEELQVLLNRVKEKVATDEQFRMISKAWSAGLESMWTLFEPVEAHSVAHSIRGTDDIAERLAATGPWRRFGFDDGTLAHLEELKLKTPNFTEVIDCIEDAVSLAVRYSSPIRVIPILMVGEPGIGKSFFTDLLSTAMSVPLSRIAVDNLQIGSDLAGLSHSYGNSSPGPIFRVLTEQDHISPLVILDELDKVPLNWGYGDPLGPLHNLLEPVSAKVFKDASFPIPIDASHVIWIATANNLAPIPDTLRSRFEIFKVSPPHAEQFDAILSEICSELASRYPTVTFDEGIVQVLSGL
ncbi:MAG: AAA family ATPase, partial [Actinomycetota bacterium]